MRQLELELHAGLAFGTLHHFIALIRAAIKSGHPNAQQLGRSADQGDGGRAVAPARDY
jgi:hypothetical protein